MITPAGMESDGSGSDCDIVYTKQESPQKVSQKTNYVPIIVEKAPNSQNGSKENNNEPIKGETVLPNGFIEPLSHKVNKGKNPTLMFAQQYKRFRENNSRQCVDTQSSQLLDDLRYAVMQGNLSVTKTILSEGIFVDSILKCGWTALMYACSAGHPEIVSFLLEQKANPNYHRDLFTPLMAVCASSKNEDDLLKCCIELLKYGANVNAHERHFTTPLMFAAREGYLRIMKQLVEHGANINSQDNRGRTALAWASFKGFGKIVRFLIEKGADIQKVDNMGQSPNDLAYEQGHKEIVKLLEKGPLLQEKSTLLSDEEKVHFSNENPNLQMKKHSHIVKSTTNSANSILKHGELELFLSGLGFPELSSLFHENHLRFHDLLIMNDEELEKVGIHQIGIRQKIMEALKGVHKKNWENSSLPNLKQSQYINCADAVAMMANIAKHLKYISSSVIYIRQQIQSQPRILELAQDSANVHDLIDEIEDGLKNVLFLNDELKFLKLHLNKVQDNIHYIPADLIVETVPSSYTNAKKFYFIIGFSFASIILGGILIKHSTNIPIISSLIPTIKFPSLR